MSRFEEFWNAWPRVNGKVHFRRVGRVKCQNKWRKEKLDDIADDILNSLEAYKGSKQWLKDNGKWIPMPHTWLNNQAWEAVPEGSGAKEEINPEALRLMETFVKEHVSDGNEAFKWWVRQPRFFQKIELLKDKAKFGVINPEYTRIRCWKER